MSVQRLEFVRPPVDQGYCGHVGCVDQPYYGDSSVVQPVPSVPSSLSQDLFSAPAMPITPMAPQPDVSKMPDESENSEVLPTPKS